ncbi:MAG: hypothetical protein WCG97_00685 [bacterium]
MNESTPTETVNKENEKSSAYELFSLDESQKEVLRKRVEEHDGLIRVFIHPIATPSDGYQEDDKSRVQGILTRTISSPNSPPILVFENSKFINVWKTIWEEKNMKQDLYLVPTMYDYPYPLVPGKPEPEDKDANGHFLDKDWSYVKEGMVAFTNAIVDIGVKKVLVGGTSLEIKDDILNRCVGNFIRFMKVGAEDTKIEIKLSEGTAPLRRSDLRDTYPELI